MVTRGDMDWENHSQVTVAINANAFYTVSAERGSASVLVHDDDFPLSDAVLSSLTQHGQRGGQRDGYGDRHDPEA